MKTRWNQVLRENSVLSPSVFQSIPVPDICLLLGSQMLRDKNTVCHKLVFFFSLLDLEFHSLTGFQISFVAVVEFEWKLKYFNVECHLLPQRFILALVLMDSFSQFSTFLGSGTGVGAPSVYELCVPACSVMSLQTAQMVAPQVPLSMEFSRQEYWNGLPFLTPGDLCNPGIKPAFLASPALEGRLFTTVPPGFQYDRLESLPGSQAQANSLMSTTI